MIYKSLKAVIQFYFFFALDTKPAVAYIYSLFDQERILEMVAECFQDWVQRRCWPKSGQFDRKRDSSMTNDECRIKEFFLFYLLKRAERHAAQAPALRERHPQFVNHHSSFFVVSYKLSVFFNPEL
jgi:hypothetical protein